MPGTSAARGKIPEWDEIPNSEFRPCPLLRSGAILSTINENEAGEAPQRRSR